MIKFKIMYLKTILLILALGLFYACGSEKGKSDASGVFEATEIVVSAEAQGKITHLNLQEGQEVLPGILLGSVDTTQLYLKKAQLLASMKAIDSRQTNIPRQISSLQQQITTQKNELVRFENLVKANAANQKQVDDIKAQLQVLERQLAAQTELLQNANNSLSEESTGLAIQVAQLDDQLQKSVITSPIRGTVLTKYVEPGELVVPGKVLFKVADLNVMFLRAYITAGQLTQLKIGQSVRILADFGENGSREYTGTISWIASQAEFTPKTIQTKDERANLVYAVKVAVENDGFLKIGMYGEMILDN